MVSLWIFIIISFFFQEAVSMTAALVAAEQQHLPMLAVHGAFAALTILDMYIGFAAGTWAKGRLNHSRFGTWVNNKMEGLHKMLGEHGEKFSFTILGIIDFPYINTFIASWLNLPRKTAFILTFVGDTISYAILWATVTGATTFLRNPWFIVLIIAAIVVALQVTTRFVHNGSKN